MLARDYIIIVIIITFLLIFTTERTEKAREKRTEVRNTRKSQPYNCYIRTCYTADKLSKCIEGVALMTSIRFDSTTEIDAFNFPQHLQTVLTK